MAYSHKKRAKTRKDIGVSSNAPKEHCSDVKCPWHGNLPVRKRTFVGTVRSSKANKTAIIEWSFTRFIPKYERYQRHHSRIVAYNPTCINAKEGSTVKVAECRPISKTKSFVVVEKLEGVKQ